MFETALAANRLADAAMPSLRDLDILSTPENYVIWYEYHAGYNPDLTRTIDIIFSNNTGFDDETLHDLYAGFFSSVKDEETVRETALRVQQIAQDIIGLCRLRPR